MSRHYSEESTQEDQIIFMAVTYTLASCICGYHVYEDVWNPGFSEFINCEREDRNPQDPYAVGLKKDGNTVGHVPCTITCICTLLLRHGGATYYSYCDWAKAVFLRFATGRSRVALHIQIYWRKDFNKESTSAAAR